MDTPTPRIPPTGLTAAQRIAIALGTAVDPGQAPEPVADPGSEPDVSDDEGPPGAAG